VTSPAAAAALSGLADAVSMCGATSTSADDAPQVKAAKYVTRANIHTTVNGVARTECRAASIVMH
jgi:hypothetical protein